MIEYVNLRDVLTVVSSYCPDDDGSCSKADVDMRDMLDELEALPSITDKINETEKQEYIYKMNNCFKESIGELSIYKDKEKAHIDADDILCEILIKLGYSDIVDIYKMIEKYYI